MKTATPFRSIPPYGALNPKPGHPTGAWLDWQCMQCGKWTKVSGAQVNAGKKTCAGRRVRCDL